MPNIHELVPDAEDLLRLPPEELAGVVLAQFNQVPDAQLSRSTFGQGPILQAYPQRLHDQVLRALMEAWAWLESEGMIAPRPGLGQEGWYFVTRRGQQIRQPVDLEAYRRASMLPKQMLHPIFVQKVSATFQRGEYDTAVFQAFKEVEVQVRAAGGFNNQDLGTDLMRRAFNANNGPLTDQNAVAGERQALSDLFAGAIGSYKNPHSHRNVPLDATEAVEMIVLASHLLKIVDSRVPAPPPAPVP